MDPNVPQRETSDERTWAMLAHLGALAGLVLSLGALGWVVPLVIWLLYRNRSPFVAFHALEELLFQIAWFVILAIGWIVTGILTLLIVGLLLIPVMIVLYFVPIVWSIVAAVRALGGEWYAYPVVGRWALNAVAPP